MLQPPQMLQPPLMSQDPRHRQESIQASNIEGVEPNEDSEQTIDAEDEKDIFEEDQEEN